MNPAKKNNAITNALASVYGQMFPGGKQEERILTTELYEQLGGRVQKKIVNQALCCVLSSIILSLIPQHFDLTLFISSLATFCCSGAYKKY